MYAEKKEVLFPRNSRVLDVAGGFGVDSMFFLEHNHTVTLLDISSVAIEGAKDTATERLLDDRFQTCLVELGKERIALEDDSVDVVYSRLGLQYFNKNTTEDIFKELFRILKKDGKAYVVVKSPDDTQEMEYFKKAAVEVEKSVFDNKGQRKSRYTRSEWENILKNAGIKKYSVSEYVDDIEGRGAKTKSGVYKLLLNEIIFSK